VYYICITKSKNKTFTAMTTQELEQFASNQESQGNLDVAILLQELIDLRRRFKTKFLIYFPGAEYADNSVYIGISGTSKEEVFEYVFGQIIKYYADVKEASDNKTGKPVNFVLCDKVLEYVTPNEHFCIDDVMSLDEFYKDGADYVVS
jgi:hypothetical protein